MSFRLQVRMGLFRLDTKAFVHKPQEIIDPSQTFGSNFPADAQMMATVHWTADPSLGFPARPYHVAIAKSPLSLKAFGTTLPLLELRPANGCFQTLLRFAQGPDGILCLTARLNAPDPRTEVFATDALGDEVPGTRQNATAPDGAAFLGPDIFGLRATGTVTLTELSIFALPPHFELPMTRVADVAPPFDTVADYEHQSYLGVRYRPLDAMAIRIRADALARANTSLPQASRLVDEVHRRDPFQYANLLIRQTFVKKSEENINSLIGNGDWSYAEQLPSGAGETRIHPSRLWQYLGLVGPIESAFLGQSVSVPVSGRFSDLTTGKDVFQAVIQSGQLPFPLVTVDVVHLSEPKDEGNAPTVFPHSSTARLSLPSPVPPISARATEPRIPERRDGPATADIELRLPRALNNNCNFVEMHFASGSIFESDVIGVPKAYFPDSDAEDQSIGGTPRFKIGPVELPFEGPDVLPLADHSRDVFGRWPKPVSTDCVLPAWPVAAPTLISAEIHYGSDGGASLATTLAWDWSIRTPYDIRIGILVAKTGNTALENLRPAHGVTRPGHASLPLSIRFNADESPVLNSSAPIPADFKIEEVAPPDGAGWGEVRRYLFTMPLGNADTIFSVDADMSVAICADAWEAVSGHTDDRRSEADSLLRQMRDPRPPVLDGVRWKLYWTSRPNGAGLASVRLAVPHIASGDVAGFHVWRASEAAVLDLAISEEFGSDPAGDDVLSAVLQERDMDVRLVQIQALVERQLWKPAFVQGFVKLFEAADTKLQLSGFDLSLSGSQTGLEFVMFSAISNSGIASDKMLLNNLAAVAVPAARIPERPELRVLTSDLAGTFAISGLCIAIAGVADGYSADDVRIFWSARSDIDDAAQLMRRLMPIKVLTRKEAARYVPEIDRICNRMTTPNVHIYLVRPPQTWGRQSWAADLLKAHGATPAQQIAGPRSPLLEVRVIPSRGPELRVVQHGPDGGGQAWLLSTYGIFQRPPPGYAPSEIYMELADISNDGVARAGPVDFETFVQNGLSVAAEGLTLAARYDLGYEQVYVNLVGGSATTRARIAASDPAGRFCTIELM